MQSFHLSMLIFTYHAQICFLYIYIFMKLLHINIHLNIIMMWWSIILWTFSISSLILSTLLHSRRWIFGKWCQDFSLCLHISLSLFLHIYIYEDMDFGSKQGIILNYLFSYYSSYLTKHLENSSKHTIVYMYTIYIQYVRTIYI